MTGSVATRGEEMIMGSEYLHKFIAELTGDTWPFGEKDYLSYFVNAAGEAMIFHRPAWARGAARLLHQDIGPWTPVDVYVAAGDDDLKVSFTNRDGVLTGVHLNRGERLWLEACWRESSDRYDSRPGDDAPADACPACGASGDESCESSNGRLRSDHVHRRR